ncbi:mechanosensitive ion channel domain-containing protein [Novipirellula sp.]|uniref:mechanosensitive ion channel domain-containing protein n=1 Tax=Novipirellula sp. TaxID=2795430 RepID=UPI0035670D44
MKRSTRTPRQVMIVAVLLIAGTGSGIAMANPQDVSPDVAVEQSVDEEKVIETPDKVEVEPVTEDVDISGRLERILNATGWFESVEVSTDEGVVFMSGVADSEQHRDWAERVAQRTTDVVAVVNRISVKARPVWDVSPAILQLRQLGRDFVQLIPLLVVGALVIFLAYLVAKLLASIARRMTARRIDSQLLQQVIASVVAVLVMLIGLYIALKVSGLSRLAVTVLGGTGLVGIALGFAFRDIAENYLSSVLISLNRPFSVGDLIELDNYKGFVRKVTTRGTLLLTLDGNHIQIPNSTIYKSVIINYSSSPRLRKDFTIGIGYDDSVTEAQDVVLQTLMKHESVLDDPAPLVLVESLGASTVNLQVLFWLDGERFDAPSVSSALMRLAKVALTEANISMPDEAREVVFPQGVPVAMLEGEQQDRVQVQPVAARNNGKPSSQKLSADSVHASKGEGDLRSISDEIQRHSDEVEDDSEENLID